MLRIIKRIVLNDIKSGVLQEEIISENMALSDADENGTQRVPFSDGAAPADPQYTVQRIQDACVTD